jgi:CRISPR system Cascade subunit CasB
MRPRKPTLDEGQHKWVRQWWHALQPREPGSERPRGELALLDRGTRARLRRCANADELLAEPATLLLAEHLIGLGSAKWPLPDNADSYVRLAWIAGVLARVKDDVDDGKTLALRLGNASGKERLPMGEIRFKRLQRASAADDLFRQWQRAVQLADDKTDVAQLADDLLAWLLELDSSVSQASNSVRFRWAYDYYLSSRERAAAQDTVIDKELTA